MPTNYERGVALELKVCNRFRDRGYFAMRSAGSHTTVDVVVMGEKIKPLMFQCKHSIRKVSMKKILSEDNVKLFEELKVDAKKFIIIHEDGERLWTVLQYKENKWVLLPQYDAVYKFVTQTKTQREREKKQNPTLPLI